MTIREKIIAAMKAPVSHEFRLAGEKEDDRPGLDRIIEGLMQKAASGDIPAARELREYFIDRFSFSKWKNSCPRA